MQGEFSGVFKAAGELFELKDNRTGAVTGYFLQADCQEQGGKTTPVRLIFPADKKMQIKRGEGFRAVFSADYRVTYSTDEKTKLPKEKHSFRVSAVKSFKLVEFKVIDLATV